MAFTLLPNETVITKSSDNSIVLSNYRITRTAGPNFMSICLDKISCIKLHHSSKDHYLVIGILSGLGSLPLFVKNEVQIGVLTLVVAGIFLALYFQSKQYIVSIFSDSGQALNFVAKGNSGVMEFVNKIDGARIDCSKMNALAGE